MTSEELAEQLKVRIEELVSFFGVNTNASVVSTPEAIELEIETDISGRLIGHRGETLRALEYLLGCFAQTAEPDLRLRVHLDIAGYRAGRAQALEALARAVADRVIASGHEEALKPMNPAERRIVHLALSAIPEVMTESHGDGRERHIVVLPRTDG